MKEYRLLRIMLFVLLLVPGYKVYLNAGPNMFCGNQQHTGFYESDPILYGADAKWAFKTNGPIIGSPVLEDNTIYASSRDSCIYAVDLDGNLKWKKKTNGKIAATPAVFSGTVYTISYDGYFYALSASDGSEKWKFKTRGEHQRGEIGYWSYLPEDEMQLDECDLYESSAVVVDSLVVFGCGDSSIYCLNTKDGSKYWEYKTGDVVHSSPAYYDGIIYCGGFDCMLYALDIKNGTKIWSATVGSNNINHTFDDVYTGNMSSPSVANGMVYIGSKQNYVAGFDAKTGAIKFKYSTGVWVISTPALAYNSLFGGTSGYNRLYMLSALNGNLKFDKTLLTSNPFTWGSPAVAGKMTYIGSLNGILYALDTMGSIKWQYKTKGNITSWNYDGTVPNKTVENYDPTKASDGEKNMNIAIEGGAILGNPIIDNGTIYIASGDGYIYALQETKRKIAINDSTINLGKIKKGAKKDTTIYFENIGSEKDSLIFEFNGPLLTKALTISPSKINIAPGEKVGVNISVNTESLYTSIYTERLIIKSGITKESNWHIKNISLETFRATDIEQAAENIEFNTYPNPLKDIMNYSYTIQERSVISISIFDLQGRVLINNSGIIQQPGEYSGKINIGKLTTGTYVCSFSANKQQIKKMLVIQ